MRQAGFRPLQFWVHDLRNDEVRATIREALSTISPLGATHAVLKNGDVIDIDAAMFLIVSSDLNLETGLIYACPVTHGETTPIRPSIRLPHGDVVCAECDRIGCIRFDVDQPTVIGPIDAADLRKVHLSLMLLLGMTL